MVGSFIKAVTKEVRGMHEAAYLLAFFALLSQILGLFRDRLLASEFGIGQTLDVYYAAFRIPDFLFVTIASLFSLYAILPVLSRIEEGSVRMLEGILVWFFALTGAAAAILYVFVPTLAPHLVPGFNLEQHGDLVTLTRILLLQPILLGASNVLSSLTQLRSRFVLYAISPLFYNCGIIFGIIALYPSMGITGLAWGVVIGAGMHMLVQVPQFFVERGLEKPKKVSVPLREILTLSVPRTLALASGQFTLLALIALASSITNGAISAFTFSMNLQAVPLAVIGMSYSVAAFPTLARFIGKGEKSSFLLHITTALRHIVFWSIPAVIFIIVLRAQIVRVILGSGAFDWDATRLTAAALAVLILSLTSQSIVYVLARGYYAAGKTARPVLLALISVIVSVASAVLLLAVFGESPFFKYFVETLLRVNGVDGTGVLMLAFGYSVGALISSGIGIWFFARDFEVSLGSLWGTVLRSFSSATIGGFFAYLTLTFMGNFVDINTFAGIFAQGLAGGIAALVVTALVLYLLKSQELREVLDALTRKLRDKGEVAVEPSELSS